jgi:hypothetical protein
MSEASNNIEQVDGLLERMHDRGYDFGPDKPGTLWPAIDRARAAGDLTDAEVEVLREMLGLADCCVVVDG